MKQLLLYSLLFVVACGNDNTATDSPTKDDSRTEEKSVQPVSPSTEGDEIVGEWEMVGSVMDTNDNLQIDEDERKNLKPPGFKDFMRLNSDGSGLFTVAKLEGRYEAKANESGKNVLTWYDTANGRHRMGTIVFISKEELHLKEPGGHGLFIWKKL